MLGRLPLHIGSDLTVRIGSAAVTLSPGQGLRAAEQLIRKSTRRMIVEEALAEPPKTKAVRRAH